MIESKNDDWITIVKPLNARSRVGLYIKSNSPRNEKINLKNFNNVANEMVGLYQIY